MNLEFLEEELAQILPSTFRITTDRKGQLIIHTGLRQDDDDELVDMDDRDEEEDEDDLEVIDPMDEDELDDEEDL